MVEDSDKYLNITDLVDIPKHNFGVEYALDVVKSTPQSPSENMIIRESATELSKVTPLPVPVAYMTGMSVAIDEVIHHKRPISHIKGKVSAYSYAVILKLSDNEQVITDPSIIAAPTKLQRLKVFRLTNTRIYAVALINGNHPRITDCYSLTFIFENLRWMVKDFHMIGGPNGTH
ncbi:MAG: hypothetical protein LBI63_06005 [Candidatus Ancillula sp.]|nr:hypothetical protein [Candidatus Ancillula sp.]